MGATSTVCLFLYFIIFSSFEAILVLSYFFSLNIVNGHIVGYSIF